MTTGQTVRLPSVDRILGDAACLELIAQYGRVQTLACARAVLAELRTAMLAGAGLGKFGEEGASIASIGRQMAERLQAQSRSQLRATRVPDLETGALCPVCGSHPVASVIRIGGQSQGYRYLHCGICESEWHMVRVKCSTCEQNGKIAYQGLDANDAAPFDPVTAKDDKLANKANDPKKVARAETCDDCHTYRKVFNQEHDYNVEPLADDLASLMLDLLVGEAGYQRASGNPLLWLGKSDSSEGQQS